MSTNRTVQAFTDVVGIFPNERANTRLTGAILLKQSDEWATQRARDMTLETIGSVSDNPTVSHPALAG
jgi:putative transposase